jgi:LysM repeat protein
MKHSHFSHLILSSTFVFLLGACAHKPVKPLEAEVSMKHTTAPSHQEVLLQEARMESDNLRAEVGALKILTAKQAGELQTLRERSQSVHHREQDQGLQLQQVRSELLASQAERDQLRKRNGELEGQVASLPDISQLVSDIQSLSSSFQQIMTNIKQLAADVVLIKREMNISSDKLTPRRTKFSSAPQPAVPATATGERQTPDSTGRIVVQNGDTLWKLARKYHVSIAQIKEWNSLDSDVIMTGLRLRVAMPKESQPAQADLPAGPPDSSARPNQENLKQMTEPVQENPPPQKNHVDKDPEPKHILSIGSPNSHSHESP